MKQILNAIGNGLARKGLVRVYWDYQKSTDIYAHCETFYGYERMTSTLEKMMRIPEDAQLDETLDYRDVCEITLK